MIKKKAVVIGAGISSLAVSCYLARLGFEVIVLEKNSFIGGRASIFKEKGFIFDKGPSWYMMPEVFEDFFGFFGKKVSDYYNLFRLPVNYRVFFDDKVVIDITKDHQQNLRLFKKLEEDGDKKLTEYLRKASYLYQLSMKELVLKSYEKGFLELFDLNIITNLFRLNLFTSLKNYINKFFKSDKPEKILSFTSVFLGGSPFNTPAFYSLIAHADLNLGVYYPMGGIHQVIKALFELSQELGVKIITKASVDKIDIKDKQVKAVYFNTKKKLIADLVVSGIDLQFTQTNLLENKWRTYDDNYWKKAVMSPSAFLIYLGLNKKIKNVEHHNLYFSNYWKKGFDEVFSKKKYPQFPSYYFHVPSKTDKSVAPKNGETMMILVPIAPGLPDNINLRQKFFDKILTHFESLVGEKIRDNIVVKKIYSLNDFKEEYNSFKGAAFGLAHTLFQTAIFRPLNKDKKIKNLYYVGQFTNPGVGMPPGLLSAKIVFNLIKKDFFK